MGVKINKKYIKANLDKYNLKVAEKKDFYVTCCNHISIIDGFITFIDERCCFVSKI